LTKSLKVLPNKVFRFIQQTQIISPAKIKNLPLGEDPETEDSETGEEKTRDNYPRIANFPIKVEDKQQDFSRIYFKSLA
jgi:hypothetical protein